MLGGCREVKKVRDMEGKNNGKRNEQLGGQIILFATYDLVSQPLN